MSRTTGAPWDLYLIEGADTYALADDQNKGQASVAAALDKVDAHVDEMGAQVAQQLAGSGQLNSVTSVNGKIGAVQLAEADLVYPLGLNTTGVDLDTITTTGHYYITSTGVAYVNGPAALGVEPGQLEVFANKGDGSTANRFIYQRFTSYNSSRVFIRCKLNAMAFSAWMELPNLTQATNLAKAHYWTAVGTAADLNTFTTGGLYICNANATASGLTNCPVVVAFMLEVHTYGGMSWQRLTTYNNNAPAQLWLRRRYNSVWSAWELVSLTVTPNAPSTDVAGLRTPGRYYLSGSYTNGPSGVTEPAMLEVFGSLDNLYIFQRLLVASGTATGTEWVRRYSSAGWTAWTQLASTAAATASTAGLMSAADKGAVDKLVADQLTAGRKEVAGAVTLAAGVTAYESTTHHGPKLYTYGRVAYLVGTVSGATQDQPVLTIPSAYAPPAAHLGSNVEVNVTGDCIATVGGVVRLAATWLY